MARCEVDVASSLISGFGSFYARQFSRTTKAFPSQQNGIIFIFKLNFREKLEDKRREDLFTEWVGDVKQENCQGLVASPQDASSESCLSSILSPIPDGKHSTRN